MSLETLSFSEAFKDVTGGNHKVKTNQYLTKGKFPIVDQGKELIAGYVDDEEMLCKATNPIIIFGDHTKIIKFIDFDFVLGADGVKVLQPCEKLYPKYAYHYLKTVNFPEKTGYMRHFKYLKLATIPVPSLNEQKRIAAILDKADEIKKNTHESEELRDIFTHSLFIDIFGDPVINPMNWEEEKIENLCDRIFAGGDVPKDSISKEYTAEYTIPIFSNGKAEKSLYGFTSIPKVDKDSVTVSARGTIGFPVVRKAPFYPIIRLIVATPNTEKVNLQYLCSAISYLEFGKGGSSIPQLTVPMLKSRTVLVPPIDLQKKFSQILESVRNIPKSTELAENNSLSIVQQILN